MKMIHTGTQLSHRYNPTYGDYFQLNQHVLEERYTLVHKVIFAVSGPIIGLYQTKDSITIVKFAPRPTYEISSPNDNYVLVHYKDLAYFISVGRRSSCITSNHDEVRGREG